MVNQKKVELFFFMTGDQLYKKVKRLKNDFEKHFAGELVTSGWNFFFLELPY